MWRGLMLTKAVEQFLRDVHWGDLDYLLIDMPPGTGDVQMGLARLLPRTDLVIVTTPALAAQKVAQRAADMARRSFLRVVGVIENMSSFTCDDGDEYELFGSGGGPRAGRLDRRPVARSGAARTGGLRRRRRGHSDLDRRRQRRGRRVPCDRGADRGRDRSAVDRRHRRHGGLLGAHARRRRDRPRSQALTAGSRGLASWPSIRLREALRSARSLVAPSAWSRISAAIRSAARRYSGSPSNARDRLSDGRNRHLVPPELAACASRNHAVRVGVLVGSLGDDEERQAEGERPEGRARTSVGDDRVAPPQHDGLRDVSVDHDVVGLGSEGGRVVLASHGDDQRDRLVTHGLDHADETRRDRGSRSFPSSHRRWACRRDDRATPAARPSNVSAAAGRSACTAARRSISGFCSDGGHVSTYKWRKSPASGSGSRPRARQCGAAASPAARNRANGISDP